MKRILIVPVAGLALLTTAVCSRPAADAPVPRRTTRPPARAPERPPLPAEAPVASPASPVSATAPASAAERPALVDAPGWAKTTGETFFVWLLGLKEEEFSAWLGTSQYADRVATYVGELSSWWTPEESQARIEDFLAKLNDRVLALQAR